MAGACVRAGTRIIDAHELPGAVQLARETTIEIEGQGKPACVARTLTRYLRQPPGSR
jgi:acyl dehydratase